MDVLEFEHTIFNFENYSLEVCSHSDIGGREDQEDYYNIETNGERLLAVLCDGMGGSEGGEIASSVTAEFICERFRETDEPDGDFFVNSIDDLDAAVFYLTDEQGRRLNAGTTIVSVIFTGGSLQWLSIGDSRLYIVRNGEIVQATKDHNYRQMLLELLGNGNITLEQYEEESSKHSALTSFVGIGGIRIYDANTSPLKLYNNDVIILTSDGLYNCTDISRNAELFSGDTQTAMRTILEGIAAVESSERDNTTFIIIKYTENGPAGIV